MAQDRRIDPDQTLHDLMEQWPATIEVFLRHKMLCVGCLVTPFHTIEDACAEYRLDQAAFEAELRDAIISAPRRDKPAQAGGDR